MQTGDIISFIEPPIGEVVAVFITELTPGEQTEIVRVAFAGYELEFPSVLFEKIEVQN